MKLQIKLKDSVKKKLATVEGALVLCIGIVLLRPLPVAGREALVPQEINWEQIIQLVDKHPALTQQDQLLAANRAKVAAVKEIPNPDVEVSLARGHSDGENQTALEWGVALTVPLDWMATRNAKIKAVQAERSEVRSQKETLRRDILLTLRLLYWRLVYEQERVESLEALDDQIGVLVQTIQKRIESGDARPIELTRVEVEKEKVVSELEMAKVLHRTQSDKLAAWVGKSNTLFYAQSKLDSLPSAPSLHTTRKQLASHPTMESTQAKLGTQQERSRLEKKSRFPEMSLALFAEQELDKNAVGVGLEMDLPLWNFNRGAIQQSKQLEGVLKTELEVRQRDLEQQLIEVHGRCNASLTHAQRFETFVIPKVTQVAATMERAYSLGEVTLLEVIDTQRTVLETQQQLLSSQLQAQLDCSELLSFVAEDNL